MTTPEQARFVRKSLDELSIEDETSFRHVGLYADLKEILRKSRYSFRILPDSGIGSWDRALFLNLTFWGQNQGGDVLVEPNLPADVVAHVCWHHLAANALGSSKSSRPSVQSLFLGEAIASAFDLYLVGRLLGHAPSSSFLETQVPAMSEAAETSGLDEDAIEDLIRGVTGDPEGAFARLRELLMDVTSALFACSDAEGALEVLTRFEAHPFAPLLHRYELANWVLYARAYGDPAPDDEAQEAEDALRAAKVPLDWLVDHWVRPALG